MAQVEEIWERLQYLVGTWTGDSQGRPGRGTGEFTFAPGLDGRLLTRQSRTDYPATEGRSAFTHQDLTFVYRDLVAGVIRADYIDNEDHVIHYRVDSSDDGSVISFECDAAPPGPGFRITYSRLDDRSVEVEFAIAPPGQPFATYVSGPAYRVNG